MTPVLTNTVHQLLGVEIPVMVAGGDKQPVKILLALTVMALPETSVMITVNCFPPLLLV